MENICCKSWRGKLAKNKILKPETQYIQTNSNINYALIIKCIFINLCILMSVYIVYALCTGHSIIPEPTALLRYDANHYCSIKNIGYTFNDQYGSSVAFFPGFPYLWKLSGLGIRQISILNLFIFLSGFMFLCRHFARNSKDILLFLSLPVIFFMYVPYSEAIFFVPSVFLLIGLSKRINWLIMLSLFLCSLCRSAANIFVPAIIITEIIAFENPSALKNIILYSLSALAGIFIVVVLQHADTGQWLGFMTTQKHWEVGLRWPNLPFHTWGNMDDLDGATFLSGIFCCCILAAMFFRCLKSKIKVPDKSFVFALLFVGGLTIFTIAFKGGFMFSLGRYIIPTAFFFVVFVNLIWQKEFTLRQIGLITLCIFAFWLLLGSFVHIRILLGYAFLTLYLSLYLLINNKSSMIRNIVFYLLYAVNIFLQIHLFFKFLDNKWVG